MYELTMSEFTMRELTAEEVAQVSGGFTVFGAALTLGATLLGIAAVVVGTIGAPVAVVIAGAITIAGLAIGGLAYAYDAASEMSTPHGTVTVESIEPTTQTESIQCTDTVPNENTESTESAAITDAGNDMPTIDATDVGDYDMEPEWGDGDGDGIGDGDGDGDGFGDGS